jgi:Cu-processing system permease protein
MNSWGVAKLMLREAMNDSLFYGLFICFGFLLLDATFGGNLGQENTQAMFNFFFTTMKLLGEVLALYYGCLTLFKEIRRRTLYNLLSMSVSRFQIVFGKFIGINLLLFLVMVFMSFLLYSVIYLELFPAFPKSLLNWNIPKAFILLNIELMLLSAIALFFSVIAATPIHAFSFTAMIYILGLYHDILQSQPPLRVVAYVLPDFQSFDISAQANGLTMVPWSMVLGTGTYGLVYTGLFLMAGAWIFSRRSFA